MSGNSTLNQNPDGKFSSRYPGGNAPALGALTIYGTVKHGNRVTIKTNGTYGFGDTGPIVAFKSTLLNTTVGDRFTNDFVGTGTLDLSVPPMVVADSLLPYGRGFQLGASESYATNKSSAVIDGRIGIYAGHASNKCYTHYAIRWPTANQNNANNLLTSDPLGGGDPAWQIKEALFGDSQGNTVPLINANYIYVYNQNYMYDKISNEWSTGTFQSGNIATIYKDVGEPYKTGVSSFDNRPLIVQRYFKSGTSFADSKYINTIAGGGLSSSHAMPDGNTEDATAYVSSSTLLDKIWLHDFVYGFNIPDGCGLTYGDCYAAFGAGAPARIDLTDNADYDSSTRKTPWLVGNQNWWSPNTIDVIVQSGDWYVDGNEDLSGLYIHVFDKDNNYIGGRML